MIKFPFLFLLLWAISPAAMLAQTLSLEELDKLKIITFETEAELESYANPETVLALDFDNDKLKTLPKALSRFKNLKRLDLGLPQMTELKGLEQFPQLQALGLYNCSKLQQLPDNLAQLPLIYLSLLHLEIADPMPQIAKITSLQHLELIHKKPIKNLDGLGQLKKLRYLDCSNKQTMVLDKLPEGLGQLSQLQNLSLSGIALKEDNSLAVLSQLKNVEVLNLNDLSFSSLAFLGEMPKLKECMFINPTGKKVLVSAWLGQMSNIQILHMENVVLDQSACDAFSQLKKLKDLTLQMVSLASFPKFHAPSLESLDIFDTESPLQWPERFSEYTALKSLSFNKCQLTSVPTQIGQLSKLRDLTLDNNQISSLPRELAQLKSLTSFSANENALQFIPSEFTLMPNLMSIDLDKNLQLKQLPASIFNHPKLVYLSFIGCPITDLPLEIKNFRYPKRPSIFCEDTPLAKDLKRWQKDLPNFSIEID